MTEQTPLNGMVRSGVSSWWWEQAGAALDSLLVHGPARLRRQQPSAPPAPNFSFPIGPTEPTFLNHLVPPNMRLNA